MAAKKAVVKPLTKAELKTLAQLTDRRAAMVDKEFNDMCADKQINEILNRTPNIVTGYPHGTVAATLDERGERYGDFTDHAEIAQKLQDVIRDHKYGVGWARMSAVQRQAVTVLCDKLARILNGDPDYADNWHDIQGYAKLVEDRLPK